MAIYKAKFLVSFRCTVFNYGSISYGLIMNLFENARLAFESALSTYSLNVEKLPVVNEIEEHVLPSMNEAYFQTLLSGDILKLAPTQADFVDCMTHKTLHEFPYLKKMEVGLRARLSRNYPPFVRHHHLLLIAKQCQDVDVFYSLLMDFRGIDILLRSSVQMNFLGLLSRTESKRSVGFSEEKQCSRNQLPEGLPLMIPSTKRRIGKFNLHNCTTDDISARIHFGKKMMLNDFASEWQGIILASSI